MGRTKGSVSKDRQVYVGPDCPSYMVRLEERYNTLRADRLVIEGCMRHEPSNDSRGMVTRAPSSVSATTVRASERVRVRDSHDARSAQDRATVRPYSETTFRKDVAYGKSPRRQCGDPETYTVPVWYLSLVNGAELTTEGRTAALAPFQRETFVEIEREHKPRKTAVSVREQRATKLREIAGTIRMGEQD